MDILVSKLLILESLCRHKTLCHRFQVRVSLCRNTILHSLLKVGSLQILGFLGILGVVVVRKFQVLHLLWIRGVGVWAS